MASKVQSKKLQKALATLEQARRDFDKARIEVQVKCSHKNVLQAPSRSYVYLDITHPPFRVCTQCGYAEEGWGSGFSYLKPDDWLMSDSPEDEVRKYIVGKVYPNGAHREVKRGLKTMRELLKS